MPEPVTVGHSNGGHVMTETRKNELATILRDVRFEVKKVMDVGHRSPMAADLAKAVMKMCDITAECAGLPTLPPKPPPTPSPHH